MSEERNPGTVRRFMGIGMVCRRKPARSQYILSWGDLRTNLPMGPILCPVHTAIRLDRLLAPPFGEAFGKLALPGVVRIAHATRSGQPP